MPFKSKAEKIKYDKDYYLRLSSEALEKRRRYVREYQRKRRASDPSYAKQVRDAYHQNHPNARKEWNAKRSSEYLIWTTLKQRCLNPKDKAYKDYGAMGIKVCDRWKKSFAAFVEDMGTRPSDRHSIDRFPDNKGNYEPNNCRWATPIEQARNKKTNHLIEHDGRVQCLAAWADEMGINQSTLRHRSIKGLKGNQLFERTEWRA